MYTAQLSRIGGVVVLTLSLCAAHAQTPGFASPIGNFAAMPIGTGGPTSVRTAMHMHHRDSPHAGNSLLLGGPWFADYEPMLAQPQPPVIVIQSQAPAPPPVEEPTLASPLLIEWRGDRFVRMGGGSSESHSPAIQADYAELTDSKARTAKPHRDLAAVELLYRDGHRESLNEYAIVGDVIYAQGNYWTNGYWRKSIQLSLLNLPETIRVNQERGVNFRLPAGPNQVVTRP